MMKGLFKYILLLMLNVAFSQSSISPFGVSQQSSHYLVSASIGEIQTLSTSSPFAKAGILQWSKADFVENNEEQIEENIEEQEEQERIDSINAQGYEGLPGLVDVAGESMTSTNITLVYTLGEVVNASYSSHSYTMKQGVLQVIADVVDGLVEEESLETTAYPSPFNDFIKVNLETEGTFVASLVSIDGKTVSTGTYSSNDFTINTATLPIGLYVLEVLNEEKGIKQRVKLLKVE